MTVSTDSGAAPRSEFSDCLWLEESPRPGWATSGDSTFTPFDEPDDRKTCLDTLGCPFKPHELPLCPANIRGCSPRDVLGAAAELTGRRVVLRGQLGTGWREPIILRHPICGELTERPSLFVYGHSAALYLTTGAPSDAFRCRGDASLLCCGFPNHADVLVVGKLTMNVIHQQGHAPRTDLVLEDPQLCAREAQ